MSAVNADELRNYRNAMDVQIGKLGRCLHAGSDLIILNAEMARLRDLFDIARLAIDRQYHAAVIRELDFDSLPDDRARARHVASLLDGYEARHGVKRPRAV